MSIFDASERSDRVARRPHKSIYALRALTSAYAVIWRRSWACWAEFEAGVTPLHCSHLQPSLALRAGSCARPPAATRLAQPVSDAVARTTMFKRFTQEECVSSQSQVKSSVGRAIRTAICDQYPKIEDVIDELLPKKESLVLAKCTNHIQLLVVKNEPIFFQQRDGPWFPTLRLVHRRASVFEDHVWRTDAGAIRFVLGGSNVMCPGFTHDDGDMKRKLNRAKLQKWPDDDRPKLYMFPNGRYCGTDDYNPFGLFHTLKR